MSTQRSDPDRIARFRNIAARSRYATLAMVVLLAVFIAIDRNRLIASLRESPVTDKNGRTVLL